MANFTTTTSAVFLPTVWSREVVRATENALVAAGLVKRYDYLVQGRGQTIDIPNISNAFTARAKVANTDVTDDTATETQTQITVNNWYYNSFIIEDIVSVQSIYDLKRLGSCYSNVVNKIPRIAGKSRNDYQQPSPFREGSQTMYGMSRKGQRYSRNYMGTYRN